MIYIRRTRVLAVLMAAAVLLVAGCSTVDSAISGAIAKQVTPSPAPAAETEKAPAQQKSAQPSPGVAQAYQFQFSAFYSAFWYMGWYGYGDSNYKVGQGTIWKSTRSGGKPDDIVTFERALLKVNADSSQWWLFKLESGKGALLYEFLVGADRVVQKVRYKDPDSGAIGEFIPPKDSQKPSTPAASGPKSKEEMAKYKVDKQTVKVPAGSFATDHYLYTDEKYNGTAESWVSTTVPGYMVKSIYSSKKNKETTTGELIKIESGVTTALASY